VDALSGQWIGLASGVAYREKALCVRPWLAAEAKGRDAGPLERLGVVAEHFSDERIARDLGLK
jgi:hypothetical protein